MGWTIAPSNVEGKALAAVITAFGFLDLLCLIVRLYARYLQRSRLDASDYVLIAGFVMTAGVVVVIWAVFTHGYGLDVSQFTAEDAMISSDLFPPTNILWTGSTSAIRISMALFYQQIFHPVRSFVVTSNIVIAVNVLVFIVSILVSFLICHPLTYIYVPVGDGHCGDVKAFETYMAVAALVNDTIIVILPMPLLWGLQMKSSKKLGLSVILSLGFIICALTIFRLIASYVYMPNNITRQSAIVIFITAMEPILGIIIACLPFFPRLFLSLRGKKYTSRFSAMPTGPSASHISMYKNRGSRSQASVQPFNRLHDTELDSIPGPAAWEQVGSQGFSESHVDRAEQEEHDWAEYAKRKEEAKKIYVCREFSVEEEEQQNMK